jgi:hypothetical protein
MKLLPELLSRGVPKLYSQRAKGLTAEAVVMFTASVGWLNWYVVEFDGEDTLYGLIRSHYTALGHFSLKGLERLRDRHGQPVAVEEGFAEAELKDLMTAWWARCP